MPRFHVKDTFELTVDRRLFVMAGTVVEGKIKVGMSIHLPFNSSLRMTARIHRIEFARRQDGEDVCLCFDFEPDELELWTGLNIADETLDVTDDKESNRQWEQRGSKIDDEGITAKDAFDILPEVRTRHGV